MSIIVFNSKILENSVFYPASGFDGGVIRDCNVNRKDWNIDCFVYCDYKETRETLHSTNMPRGYRLVAEHELKESDLVPNGWRQVIPPNFDMEGYKFTLNAFANRHPFATWMVFERLPEFGEKHGPERFSLIFITADGVAAYQALYWSNNIKPRAVAIIQPGTGFGGNWTDFYETTDPFYWTVSHNPAGMPDFVYCDSRLEWPDYALEQSLPDYPHRRVTLWKNLKNEKK